MPKTSELPVVTSASASDKIIGLVSGVTSQITKNNLLAGGGLLSRAEALALTDTSNISILAVYHGGVVCHYEKDASGTALTTADGQNWSPLSGEPATPQHFGAVGNGSVDDTAAIQAALDSAAEQVYFPEGVYKITSALTITNQNKVLFGFGPRGGTEIRQVTSGANGIVVSNNDAYRFGLSGIKLGASNEPSGVGLTITYSAASVPQDRYHFNLHFQNVVFSGSDDGGRSGAWATCVKLVNCDNAHFFNCVFRGKWDVSAALTSEDRYWLAGTTGVEFTAPTDIQPVNMKMLSCEFRNLEVSYTSSGDMEGMTFQNNYIVQCKYGPNVDFTALTKADTLDPGLFFQSNHINTQRYSLKVSGAYEAFITHNEFYRAQQVPSTPWVCVDATAVTHSIIADNVISGASTINTPGTISGFKFTNCQRNSVHHNIFINMDTGGGSDALVEFTDSASSLNRVTDNYDNTAAPTLPMVTFSGTATSAAVSQHALSAAPFTSGSFTGITIASSLTNFGAVSIPASRAVPGAQFRVRATFEMVKGGIGGVSFASISYATSTGTGTFETGTTSISAVTGWDCAAGGTWRTQVDGVWTVATGGQTTLAFRGTSAGSDSTGAVWYTVEQIR